MGYGRLFLHLGLGCVVYVVGPMPPVPFVLSLLKVFDLCGHKVQLVCQIRKTAFLRSYAYAWYGYGQGNGSVGRRTDACPEPGVYCTLQWI